MGFDAGPVSGLNISRARVVAIGTALSRVTGFIRTVTVLAALGAGLLGDAYNTANVLPNAVYDLLMGGVLSAVVVPLLAAARQEHDDEGLAYTQRLFTLSVVVLLVVTAASVLAAPLLVSAYAHGFRGDQYAVAVLWARLFLPQILFYGLGTLIGAILNTRGHFAAPAWAPVLNNLIVTGVAGVFLAVTSASPSPSSITPGQVAWIGWGTTIAVAAQTLVMLPALRASGFVVRARFDWLHTGLARTVRMSAWALVYVVVNQAGLLVVTNLATAAGRQAVQKHAGHDAGYTVYVNAYQLFQLPYAIVAVSVITVLLPALSQAAAAGRLGVVRANVSRTLRLTGAVLVPAAAALVVLGPTLAVLLLGHGHMSTSSASYLGLVLAAFALGLVPFAAFQVQIRALYALGDARSPALVNAAATVLNIVLDLVAFTVLPAGYQVLGLALGYSASYLLALAGSTWALKGHLGLVDGHHILGTHLRLLAATVPAALAALAAVSLGAHLPFPPQGANMVVLGLAASLGAGLFWLTSRRLHIQEVDTVVHLIQHRPTTT